MKTSSTYPFKAFAAACIATITTLFAQAIYYSDAVLAQVDDVVITSFEVKQYAEPREEQLKQQFKGQELIDKTIALRRQVLDMLIERELIYLEFKALKATIPQFLIQERLDNLILDTTGGNLREFENRLNIREQMTMTELKERLRKDIAIELLRREKVSKGISIPDEAIKEYYKANATQFIKPRRFHLYTILIRKQGKFEGKLDETCDEILDKLKKGTPFQELAKQYSESPNAEQGGDQGWLSEVNEQLMETIKKMEPGQTWNKPIDLGRNIYFIHVAEIDGGGIPELDNDLKKHIKDLLTQKEEKIKSERFIRELYMKYPVKRMDGLKY
jgi:parvulin-like peptidyl-prolyl isomerase